MRIYTWLSMNLRTGGAIYHEEDYIGPVALAGGGGTEVNNETVPTGPFGPQIPYILGLFQEAANLYNEGAPEAYGNAGQQLTADINPNIQNTQDAIGGLAGGNIDQNQVIQQFLQQLAGQQNPGSQLGQALAPGIQGGINEQLGAGGNELTDLATGQTGNIQGAYDTVYGQAQPGGPLATGTQGGQTDASQAIGQLLQGGGGQNPYLESLVQGAMQGQYDSFDRNILPGIRTEAQSAGQIGGTRQGIAEGIASSDLVNQERMLRENIYGNAFGQQVGAQGNVVQNLLGSQLGDQGAALDAERIANQDYQQYIQSLLQGTQQGGGFLGQGLGLGYDAIGSGTAQAGNIFNQGNSQQLAQQMQALGLIPGFQAQSLGQMGAVNQLGLQQYGLDQNAIDALSEQYYFNQNSPFNLLSQYQQYVTGPYGGTVGNYSGNPYGYNPINPYQPNPNQPYNPYIPPYTAGPGGGNPYQVDPRDMMQPPGGPGFVGDGPRYEPPIPQQQLPIGNPRQAPQNPAQLQTTTNGPQQPQQQVATTQPVQAPPQVQNSTPFPTRPQPGTYLR